MHRPLLALAALALLPGGVLAAGGAEKAATVCAMLNKSHYPEDALERIRPFAYHARDELSGAEAFRYLLETPCEQPVVGDRDRTVEKPMIQAMLDHFTLAWEPGQARSLSLEQSTINHYSDIPGRYLSAIGQFAARSDDVDAVAEYLREFPERVMDPRSHIESLLSRTASPVAWAYYSSLLENAERSLRRLRLRNETDLHGFQPRWIDETEFGPLLERAHSGDLDAMRRIMSFEKRYRRGNDAQRQHFQRVYGLDHEQIAERVLEVDWISRGLEQDLDLAHVYAAESASDEAKKRSHLEAASEQGFINAKRLLAGHLSRDAAEAEAFWRLIDQLAAANDPYAYLVRGLQALQTGSPERARDLLYDGYYAEDTVELNRAQLRTLRQQLFVDRSADPNRAFLDLWVIHGSGRPEDGFRRPETLERLMEWGSDDAVKVTFNYVAAYEGALAIQLTSAGEETRQEYSSGNWFGRSGVSAPEEIHPLIRAMAEHLAAGDIPPFDLDQLAMHNRGGIHSIIDKEVTAPLLYWYEDRWFEHGVRDVLERHDDLIDTRSAALGGWKFVALAQPRAERYGWAEFVDFMAYELLRSQVLEGKAISRVAHDRLRASDSRVADVFACRIEAWREDPDLPIATFHERDMCGRGA